MQYYNIHAAIEDRFCKFCKYCSIFVDFLSLIHPRNISRPFSIIYLHNQYQRHSWIKQSLKYHLNIRMKNIIHPWHDKSSNLIIVLFVVSVVSVEFIFTILIRMEFMYFLLKKKNVKCIVYNDHRRSRVHL